MRQIGKVLTSLYLGYKAKSAILMNTTPVAEYLDKKTFWLARSWGRNPRISIKCLKFKQLSLRAENFTS